MIMSKKYYLSALLLLSIALLSFQSSLAQSLIQSTMLSKGDKAPVFTAEASLAGKEFTFSLKEALSKGPVVVYFYPAAYTGGCDLEAHTFAELSDQFTAAGATIIGVSADNIARLNVFSADPEFCSGKFAVSSDPDGDIARTYGLKMMPPKSGVKDIHGKPVDHGFLPRTTFVINAEGTIVAVFSSTMDQIAPDEHVKESLAIVKQLNAGKPS